MSERKYIQQKVSEILTHHKDAPEKGKALACSYVVLTMGLEDVKIIEAGQNSSLADYYLLASARSTTALEATADELLRQAKLSQIKTHTHEGKGGSEWQLIDLGDVIVHLFTESSRDIYALDELWSDWQPLDIPQEYYFASSAQTEAETEQGDDSYF